ncbi:MAG TPA: glycosyltransferase [Rhodospirillales bacterium]|nr:glycosyltransferase [Rhodospirillales bacterium]
MTDAVPLFSVIIPFKVWNPDLDECLRRLAGMEGPAWEAILLPDDETVLPEEYAGLPITVIPTSEVGPAIKRDRGAESAKAPYLAFIDDDAYPFRDWLREAEKALTQDGDELSAIGGPAITPASDPFWSRVSGAVFLSRLSGGFPERYVPVEPGRFIDDWPSVNLIVAKNVFLEIGGFDSVYWPGEDTKLCRDIVTRGGRIRYIPSMKVHHHRRASLKKHLVQVGNYGFHRGLFARKYPETSRKPIFFIPSLFVLFLAIGLPGSYFIKEVYWLFAIGMGAYGVALVKVFGDMVKYEPIVIGVLALPYVFMTHIWYGVRFMVGLASNNYKASLGR